MKFFESFEENEIFFTDFAQIATYNNVDFKVILEDNYSLQTYANFNLSGDELRAQVRKKDVLDNNINFESIIKIDDIDYIVKDVQKNNTGIYALKLLIAE